MGSADEEFMALSGLHWRARQIYKVGFKMSTKVLVGIIARLDTILHHHQGPTA